MSQIVSIPERGDRITRGDGLATVPLLDFFDEIVQRLNANLLGNQVQLMSYEVDELPSAATAGGLIFVTDETGGAVPAFSDGVNWRRVTDRAVVS